MIPFDLVYVVDDEKFDRLLYKRVIEKSGLVGSLELYPDAESALKALQDTTRSPDLILLEINMPRMTGFDFLDAVDEQLTLSDPPTSVAVLTTSENPSDKSRAESYKSVRRFLSKPLTKGHLLELAENGPVERGDNPGNQTVGTSLQ